MKKKYLTKILVFLSVLILTVSLFFACNANEEIKTSEMELFYPEIGQMHNQGLDSILKDLWKAKIEIDVANLQTQTRSILQPSFTSQKAIEIIKESTVSNLKEILSDFPDEILQESVFNKIMYDVVVPTRAENELLYSLTPFQQKYYSRIQNLADEEGITVLQFQKQLLELQQEIKGNAPAGSNEADALYYGISVAYYSAQYWEDKAVQWVCLASRALAIESENEVKTRTSGVLLFSKKKFYEGQLVPDADDAQAYYVLIDTGDAHFYTGIRMLCPDGLLFNPNICACDWAFNWSSVLKGDVSGAVVGAVEGAMAGSLAGGAGAVPGGVGGGLIGGVAGSAGSAIEQLWDYFF